MLHITIILQSLWFDFESYALWFDFESYSMI